MKSKKNYEKCEPGSLKPEKEMKSSDNIEENACNNLISLSYESKSNPGAGIPEPVELPMINTKEYFNSGKPFYTNSRRNFQGVSSNSGRSLFRNSKTPLFKDKFNGLFNSDSELIDLTKELEINNKRYSSNPLYGYNRDSYFSDSKFPNHNVKSNLKLESQDFTQSNSRSIIFNNIETNNVNYKNFTKPNNLNNPSAAKNNLKNFQYGNKQDSGKINFSTKDHIKKFYEMLNTLEESFESINMFLCDSIGSGCHILMLKEILYNKIACWKEFLDSKIDKNLIDLENLEQNYKINFNLKQYGSFYDKHEEKDLNDEELEVAKSLMDLIRKQ